MVRARAAASVERLVVQARLPPILCGMTRGVSRPGQVEEKHTVVVLDTAAGTPSLSRHVQEASKTRSAPPSEPVMFWLRTRCI